MARPRKPSKDLKLKRRITCPPYAIGYAVLRPLKVPRWYTRIGIGSYIATPYTDYPGAEAKVREILRERIEEYLNPSEPEKERIIPANLDALFAEYEAAMLSTASDSQRRQYLAAVKYYLSGGLPLDKDRIEQYIIPIHAATTLSTQTQEIYLRALRRAFDYAIKREYMKGNPIEILDAPKVVNSSRRPRTEEEMIRIRRWMREHTPRRVQLFYRLQSLTSMRYMEVHTLRVSSIERSASGDPIKLRIIGKGDRLRHFPLIAPKSVKASAASGNKHSRLRVALVRQVNTILDELVMMTRENEPGDDGSSDDRLFPYDNLLYVRDLFWKCRMALGEDTSDSRSTHTIRKHGLWYWREKLGLDRKQRSELAGHSEKIAREHYEEFTAEELAEMTMA